VMVALRLGTDLGVLPFDLHLLSPDRGFFEHRFCTTGIQGVQGLAASSHK